MDLLDRPPLPSARRVEAQRLARVLLAVYRDVGWASTCLHVRLRRGWVVPDLAAARGEPPTDGRLTAAPELVLLLRPGSASGSAPQEWLVAGAAAVWEIGPDVVVEHRAAGVTGLRRRGEQLLPPHGVDPITVDALLPRPGAAGPLG